MVANHGHLCQFLQLVRVVFWAKWIVAPTINMHAIWNFKEVMPNKVFFHDCCMNKFAVGIAGGFPIEVIRQLASQPLVTSIG